MFNPATVTNIRERLAAKRSCQLQLDWAGKPLRLWLIPASLLDDSHPSDGPHLLLVLEHYGSALIDVTAPLTVSRLIMSNFPATLASNTLQLLRQVFAENNRLTTGSTHGQLPNTQTRKQNDDE